MLLLSLLTASCAYYPYSGGYNYYQYPYYYGNYGRYGYGYYPPFGFSYGYGGGYHGGYREVPMSAADPVYTPRGQLFGFFKITGSS